MPTFAAMVARRANRWQGNEIDLSDVESIDDVADLMRDAAVDDGPVVLFVEQDDEWFGIVRLDDTNDPRIFISDARMVASSELAAILFEDEVPQDVLDEVDASLTEDDDEEAAESDDEPSVRPTPEPRGASDLLADFGVSGGDLLAMCAEEGALPADVIAGICERLGCSDEVEVYR